MLSSRLFVLPYHIGFSGFCSRLPHWTLAVAAALAAECDTDRERQVYQLLAEGNSNKDIANRLNLSLHMVKTIAGELWRKWTCTALPSWC
jgi:DNA-binding NarL/FixJ family response regulator